MAITPLQDYEKACNRLKDAFITSLYPDVNDKERILEEDGYWVGEAIGEIYNWWDWYINANQMADYFKYGFTPEQFFNWYDQWVEKESKKEGTSVNMRNFLKLEKPSVE